MSACASNVKPVAPIILTNSQFSVKDRPEVPLKSTPIDDALFMLRTEYALDYCEAQISELKNVLEVQGAQISDVRVTAQKERKKVLGIF